jgi:hypothetical protein
MTARRLAAFSLVFALAACHLVDQRDFDAKAGRPPVPRPAKVVPPPPALVTISYATPNPQYREALTAVVRQALARKPDVLFTVTTVVPTAPDAEAVATGRQVAQAIVDGGAEPGQVEQLVRTEPGLAAMLVRVTVH